MTARPVVVAIAGDAGGAAAVGPVLEALRREGIVEVVALAYRQAPAAWASRGIAFEAVTEQMDEAGILVLLRDLGATALLAGTSINGVDLERIFTRVARRLAIPSVAVLDMWSSYSARFGAERGVGPDVPDRIAVMDARAREVMLAEGFRPGQIVVTGHPGFDDLIDARRNFGMTERRRLRDALGVSDAERMVLFASQPLTQVWGEDVTVDGHAGYTERTVLPAVLSSLDRLAPRLASPLTLVVRPHPRQGTPEVPGAHPYRVLATRHGTPREVAMSADAVLGMCTILLLESALLGIPTVSVQPGLRTPDALPPLPELVRVYRSEDLDGALDAALRSSNVEARLASCVAPRRYDAPPTGASGDAAQHVAEVLYGLLDMTF